MVQRREQEETRPARPWEESPRELGQRLQQAARWVNQNYDVRGLCRGLPGRLHALVSEARGDRLPK